MKNKLLQAGSLVSAMAFASSMAYADEQDNSTNEENMTATTVTQEQQRADEMKNTRRLLHAISRDLKEEIQTLRPVARLGFDMMEDRLIQGINSLAETPTQELLEDLADTKTKSYANWNSYLNVFAYHISPDLVNMLHIAGKTAAMENNCLLPPREWEYIRSEETSVTDITCNERGNIEMLTVRLKDPDPALRSADGRGQFAHYDFDTNMAYFTEPFSNFTWEENAIHDRHKRGGLPFDQINDEKIAEIELLRKSFNNVIWDTRIDMRNKISDTDLYKASTRALQISIAEEHRIPFAKNPHFKP